MGHECVGVVVSVGPDVTHLAVGDRVAIVRPVPHQSARKDGATSAHKKFIGSAVNKAPATQGAAHNMISTSILYPSSGGTSVGACPVKWPCGRRACSPASSLGWAAWRAHSSTPAALSLLAVCCLSLRLKRLVVWCHHNTAIMGRHTPGGRVVWAGVSLLNPLCQF